MYTNQMRFTGLSGIDTESMVTKLMKAESLKLDKLKQSNQLVLWKQEAYRDAASKFQSFYNTFLSFSSPLTNMRSATTFKNLVSSVKVSGTDTASTALGVRPTGNATAGNFSVLVQQMAKGDKYVASSSAVSNGAHAVDPVNPANITEGDTISFSLDGGPVKTITFEAADITALSGAGFSNDKLKDILNSKLLTAYGTETVNGNQQQKVFANINPDGRMVINAGNLHNLVIYDSPTTRSKETAGANLPTDLSVLSGMKFTVTRGTAEPVVITLGDFTDTSDEDDLLEDLNAKLARHGITASSDGGKLVFKNERQNQTVTIDDSENSGFMAAVGFSGPITAAKNSSLANMGFAGGGTSNAVDLSRPLENLLPATAFSNNKIAFTINGKSFDFDKTDTLQTVINKVNAGGTGAKISFDKIANTLVMESSTTGASNKITFTDDTGSFFASLGLDQANPTQSAQDAVIFFDGVRTTRETNTFIVNDIEFTLSAASVGQTFDVGVKSDVNGVVDNIKKFVEEYNKLLEYANDQARTRRPVSGKTRYEPLTDDQRKAMSEKEIELWETQAKTGMLYRDDIMTGAVQSLRSLMYQPVDLGDGKSISLYEIGITTSPGFTAIGQLVIDEDKLRAALETRGEDVVALFTKDSSIPFSDKANSAQRLREEGLANRLYETIGDISIGSDSKIGKRAGFKGTASDLDNVLQKQLKDYADKIDNMTSYLARRESYYYNMFARMEAAVNQSNSQASYLASMFGMGG